MNVLRFYDELPDMECLSGDTLPAFTIGVDADTTGCSMQLILAERDGDQVVYKDCTQVDGGFSVQLTSAETAGLSGVYELHFSMTDGNGLVYRKLTGVLTVHPAPKGGIA
ncbi:MAG: hypothetical protein K2I93_02700 [Oscillospiraceae bacterium]|nr:hypothetical protein [Oscillospiraceae bacterium]